MTVTIPETSPTRYIGGMGALNLNSDGCTGDWHSIETFYRPTENHTRSFISGSGCATDTTALLGEAGIFECSALLDEMKIPHAEGPAYAATHARAIADLVIDAALRGKYANYLRLDDFMPRISDKQSVFDLLAMALPKLTLPQQQLVSSWQQEHANLANREEIAEGRPPAF
jgi:hypothetical protein